MSAPPVTDAAGGLGKRSRAARPAATIAGAAIAALAVPALVNHRLARRAERDYPPAGRFVQVDGVRLHYVERGRGEPLVLLHGNGSMIHDFETSGLIALAARKYRVIAIDRPGFGHSGRPRSTVWTPEAQADVVHAALTQLGVEYATALGHSWGCSVAVALTHKYPRLVRGLVLASGYYYPTVRADVVAMSGPAVPLVGDIMRYSISPIISRLMWPIMMRKLFGPQPAPEKFSGFPKALAVRSSQIRASAVESALVIPDAFRKRGSYAELKMPVAIITGAEDRLIDPEAQSARLHKDTQQSSFHLVPGAGHMVHQTATADVMAAIDKAAPSAGPVRDFQVA